MTGESGPESCGTHVIVLRRLQLVYSPGSPGHAGLPGRVPAGSGSGQRFETRGIPGSPG